MRLNHVALAVTDSERSASFYRAHFGFDRTVHEDEHFTLLSDPEGSVLALFPGVATPAEGFHFGLQVEDPDDVRAARERLRDAGVREIEWQDDAEFVRVQVADPDGYLVELFAYRR